MRHFTAMKQPILVLCIVLIAIVTVVSSMETESPSNTLGTITPGGGDFGATVDDTVAVPQASCPSAVGTSCLDLIASNPPSVHDAMTVVALDLAAHAYDSPENITLYAKSIMGATDARFVSNDTTDTQMIVASTATTLIILFRGTESKQDWGINAGMDLIQTPLGTVHEGFYTAAMSVYPQLLKILKQINPQNSKKVYVAGHSLGAALAILTAAQLEADPAVKSTVDGVYSIGGPRAGAKDWEAMYWKLGLELKTLRFVYYKDGVPLVPTQEMGYVHVGKTILLPREADSCRVTFKEEYDVCENDKSGVDFVKFVGAQYTCEKFLVKGEPLHTAFCRVNSHKQNVGAYVSLFSSYICNLVDPEQFVGSVCCAVIENLAVTVKTGILLYHDAANYVTSITKACTSECSTQQYRQCGGGWSAADEKVAAIPIAVDPIQKMTPAEIDAALRAVQRGEIEIDGAVNASSPPPFVVEKQSLWGSPFASLKNLFQK